MDSREVISIPPTLVVSLSVYTDFIQQGVLPEDWIDSRVFIDWNGAIDVELLTRLVGCQGADRVFFNVIIPEGREFGAAVFSQVLSMGVATIDMPTEYFEETNVTQKMGILNKVLIAKGLWKSEGRPDIPVCPTFEEDELRLMGKAVQASFHLLDPKLAMQVLEKITVRFPDLFPEPVPYKCFHLRFVGMQKDRSKVKAAVVLRKHKKIGTQEALNLLGNYPVMLFRHYSSEDVTKIGLEFQRAGAVVDKVECTDEEHQNHSSRFDPLGPYIPTAS